MAIKTQHRAFPSVVTPPPAGESLQEKANCPRGGRLASSLLILRHKKGGDLENCFLKVNNSSSGMTIILTLSHKGV